MSVIPFTFECIRDIKKIFIKQLPSDLTIDKNRELVHHTLHELSQKKLQSVDMEVNKAEVKELRRKSAELQKQIHGFKNLENKIQQYKERRNLYEEIKQESQKIKEMSSIVLRKEKKAYTRVMKRMGLIEKGVVTTKGNVTC